MKQPRQKEVPSDKSSGYGSDPDEGPAKKKKKKQKTQKPATVIDEEDEKEGSDEEEAEDENEPEEGAGKFVMAPGPELCETEDYSQSLPEWQYYNLQNELLEAIRENGFTKPTEIQRLTLAPAILGRRDILGAAETGSGKTLAFGLPILNGILHLKKQWITNPNCSIRKGGEYRDDLFTSNLFLNPPNSSSASCPRRE